MHNFRKFHIWSDSMILVTKIYKLLENLPRDERFNLISQIKRCAVSIPSNIAEGAGRGSNKDFNRFLAYSTGSSYELETQLLLCIELNLVSKELPTPVLNDLDVLQKKIYNFKKTLV